MHADGNSYIKMLETLCDNKYKSYTNNLNKRIALHNCSKGAKFTRGRKWKLIYKEKYQSKKEAISREYYIKNNRTFRNKIKNENFNITSL